jgi:predicted nucleic acid-binding protein
MTAPLFADTGYFLALINPRDALHERAIEQGRLPGRPVITTAWVLQELADGLCAPKLRGAFLRILETLQSDASTILVEPEPNLWRRGLALYAARPDKEWSLTDCISIVVMTERGLTEALTGDHHFEQAGLRALLRQS